jgi:hypothetical protein
MLELALSVTTQATGVAKPADVAALGRSTWSLRVLSSAASLVRAATDTSALYWVRELAPAFVGARASPAAHLAALLLAREPHTATLALLPPGYDPQPAAHETAQEWLGAVGAAMEQLHRRAGVRQVPATAHDHARFVALARRGGGGDGGKAA